MQSYIRALVHAGPEDAGNRRVVLVVFIGGVTFAEINALRFLSNQPGTKCEFVVLTTKVINGTSLLESFVEDRVKEAMKFFADTA